MSDKEKINDTTSKPQKPIPPKFPSDRIEKGENPIKIEKRKK